MGRVSDVFQIDPAQHSPLFMNERKELTACTFGISIMQTDSHATLLIVEDEMLIAMNIELALEDLGCSRIEIQTSVPGAIDYLNSHSPAYAFLDINVGGQTAYPVAELLAEKGIPFAFCSSQSPTTLPEEWRGRPFLEKPLDEARLNEVIAELQHTNISQG